MRFDWSLICSCRESTEYWMAFWLAEVNRHTITNMAASNPPMR